MSNEKVLDAKLAGFNGPYFPGVLGRIQKRYAYHPERFNEMFYDRLRERIGAPRLKHFPVTSDVTSPVRSPWPVGIQFRHGGKQWKILLPNALDSDKKDGTFAARHVALYCQGDPSPEEIEEAAKFVAHVFANTYRMKYKAAVTLSKANDTK